MSISPDLLHEALDGRSILGPGHGESSALVRLAATVRRLQPGGPSPAAVARMTTRFEKLLERPQRRGYLVLLGAWLGVGAQPRPLVQRLAAGALLFASVGGGASVATGVDPARAVGGTVHFLTNAIANLSPRGDGSELSLLLVTETPTPAAGESATPTPAATATPDITPTQTPAPTQRPAGPSAVDSGALPAPNGAAAATSTPPPPSGSGVLLPLPTATAPAAPTPKPMLTPAATPTATAPVATTPVPQPPTSTATAPAPTATPSPSATATPTQRPDDGRGDR